MAVLIMFDAENFPLPVSSFPHVCGCTSRSGSKRTLWPPAFLLSPVDSSARNSSEQKSAARFGQDVLVTAVENFTESVHHKETDSK
jgi:hypothetical protein